MVQGREAVFLGRSALKVRAGVTGVRVRGRGIVTPAYCAIETNFKQT
jgi:hypothetical protein